MSSLTHNQSMNGAWIEVFKAGIHTDSSGKTGNWTPEKIDAYLAKYNPAFHEAPLRIDHPDPKQRNANGPSFGWIEATKRVGDIVYVKLSQVSKQLEEWVRQGLVKKRSIAFDDRYGIHHLAFLGYNCPAVPGMENVYSGPDSCLAFEFEFKFNETVKTSVPNPAETANVLAKRAQQYQDQEAAAGRYVTMTEAVYYVKKLA